MEVQNVSGIIIVTDNLLGIVIPCKFSFSLFKSTYLLLVLNSSKSNLNFYYYYFFKRISFVVLSTLTVAVYDIFKDPHVISRND